MSEGPMHVVDLIRELEKFPMEAVVRVTGDATVATRVEEGRCYACGSPEVSIR